MLVSCMLLQILIQVYVYWIFVYLYGRFTSSQMYRLGCIPALLAGECMDEKSGISLLAWVWSSPNSLKQTKQDREENASVRI